MLIFIYSAQVKPFNLAFLVVKLFMCLALLAELLFIVGDSLLNAGGGNFGLVYLFIFSFLVLHEQPLM